MMKASSIETSHLRTAYLERYCYVITTAISINVYSLDILLPPSLSPSFSLSLSSLPPYRT